MERQRHHDAIARCTEDRLNRRDAAMRLLGDGDITTAECARLLGCHRATVTRRAKAMGINPKQARAALLKRLSACAEKFGELFEVTFTSAGPRERSHPDN